MVGSNLANGQLNKPKIGEIWVVTIPEIFYEESGDINIRILDRPFLVLDDGRGLIVEEDTKNFHCFKITSQNDPFKRKKIDNWKEIGLLKESYVRIEMPLKIELKQFQRRITELPSEQMVGMYKELFDLLNIESLEKICKSLKDLEQELQETGTK
jgi:hypothetical protein